MLFGTLFGTPLPIASFFCKEVSEAHDFVHFAIRVFL